jgi:hypothetical protein
MVRNLLAAAWLCAIGVLPSAAESPEISDPAWQALERRAAALRPAADEVKWQQLPWIVDAKEAIQIAKSEKRPIFFWAAGGRGRDGLPLERC